MGEVEEFEEDLRSIGIRLSTPVIAALAIIFGILVLVLEKFHTIFIATFFIIQGTIMLLSYYGARQKLTKSRKKRPATT